MRDPVQTQWNQGSPLNIRCRARPGLKMKRRSPSRKTKATNGTGTIVLSIKNHRSKHQSRCSSLPLRKLCATRLKLEAIMFVFILSLGLVILSARNVRADLISSDPQQVAVTFNVQVLDANTGSPISGASVYLDGNFQGTTDSNGNVGVSTTYPPADHSYSVSANGYEGMSGTWIIGSNSGGGVTVQLTPNFSQPPNPQPPSSNTVTFNVQVLDANAGNGILGASVYLDGVFQGTTDASGTVGVSTTYPPAEHSYQVTAIGYQDMSGTWTIGSNSGGYFTVQLTPSTSQPPSGPSGSQLQVQLIPQAYDVDCWAASSAMVIGYYGGFSMSPGFEVKIQQALEQMYNANGYAVSGTSQGVPLSIGMFGVNGPYADIMAQFGVQVNTEYGLPFDQIKSEIDGGHPIMVLLNEGNNWGHVEVIVGYDSSSNQVYINNPWPVDYGQQGWVDYASLNQELYNSYEYPSAITTSSMTPRYSVTTPFATSDANSLPSRVLFLKNSKQLLGPRFSTHTIDREFLGYNLFSN